MKKNYDLYITFAEAPKNADKKLNEFVDQIVSTLELALQRILGNEIKIALKGRDFKAETVSKTIQSSALALTFLHPLFEDDTEYQMELARICETLDLQTCDEQHSQCLFKVCLEPLGKELSPAILENILSYDFYEKNRFNRRTKRMDFTSDDALGVIYGKILDLAHDIAEQIQHKDQDNSETKYAFLGLTSFDQLAARDEIRRELLHFGYRILPSANIPLTGEAFEEAINGYLEKSSLIVQLMGTQYGETLKGTKYSVTDYQNQVIRAFQEKHKENPIRRLIWIPQGTKISDQRQALYLKRMRRDDAINNSEIIESPLVSFKSILASNIENPTTTTSPDKDSISKVYLLAEEEAAIETEQLNATLSSSGLKINTLDYNEQSGIFTRHLNALRNSDAVVIFQKSENQYWLSSKLRDLVKSPGIGRTKPFKKIVIASPVLPDAQLTRMIKAPIEIIEDVNASPDTILNKLIAE